MYSMSDAPLRQTVDRQSRPVAERVSLGFVSFSWEESDAGLFGRRSHRHPQDSERQMKKKSVSRLGIECRSSDFRSDALPIKLSRPTP